MGGCCSAEGEPEHAASAPPDELGSDSAVTSERSPTVSASDCTASTANKECPVVRETTPQQTCRVPPQDFFSGPPTLLSLHASVSANSTSDFTPMCMFNPLVVQVEHIPRVTLEELSRRRANAGDGSSTNNGSSHTVVSVEALPITVVALPLARRLCSRQ